MKIHGKRRNMIADRTTKNRLTLPQPAKVCALTLAISFANIGYAQEEPLEEIMVTGSRIQRSGMETPTPVTTVTATALADMNPRQLVEGISQLPQFLNNQRPQTTGPLTSGGSNLNLRGAGPSRTLVLLNGRRVPNGNRYGAANISTFPEGAISSVETVTGGASAAYGTDAVAGVVNFILDTNFEGFTGKAQMGTTSRSDGDNVGFGGTYGTALGDKGHLLLSADYFDQDLIQSLDALKDRPWFRQRAWVTNPTPGGPTFITRDFVRQTNMSVGGIINQPGSALNKLEFFREGNNVVARPLPFNGVGRLDGGCNCYAESQRDPTWGMDADNAVQNGNKRYSGFLFADYDISDNFNVFVQGMYGFAQVSGPWFTTPILTGPWQATIFSGNPYLPANVQSIMTQENRATFNMGMSGLSRQDVRGPLDWYNADQNDELLSFTTGFEYSFEGGWLDGWNANYYAQYGENEQELIFQNGLIMGRLPLSLDAVRDPQGRIVCRAALVNPATFGDCVPVNLFGGVGSVSPEAARYLLDDEAIVRSDSEQLFSEFVLDGEIHEGFGAGPILMAVGGSYRRDEILQRKDDLRDEFVYLNGVSTGFRGLIPENLPNGMPGVRAGSVPAGFTGNNSLSNVLFTGSIQTPDTVLAGHFAVKEVFSEINIPILENMTFAQGLEGNVSYRYADYTGSGGIESWKYGLSWQVSDSLRFRATRSRDVRAANIRERFDATAGGANVLDPVFANASFGTASRTGGNPNVNPEKADTVTAGVVWQPAGALDGFQFSADWYDIDINDALGQLTFQNIVDGCFRGATDLCQYVLRDPVSNQIVRIDSLFINIANQRLKGLDFEAGYQTEIDMLPGGAESLAFRLYANKILDNYNQFPGAPRDNLALEQPEWRLVPSLVYTNGAFRAFVQGRWIDGRTLNRLWVEGINVDDNSVPSVTYADLTLSYELDINEQNYRLFANVGNVFDRDPPQTPGNTGFVGGTGGPNAALYDTVGRTYTLGVNVRF